MSYYPVPGGYPSVGHPASGPTGSFATSHAGSSPVPHSSDPQHLNTPAAYGYADPETASGLEAWFNFRNTGYLKGFVVGAGVALVLTNPTVQKALVSGAVKLWSSVQGGVEEVKEQIQDIKAEMSQKD